MAESLIQYSFAAGELSPTLYGRVELAKYRIGAALMRNFYVDYRGGASNRPGTLFVGQCPDTKAKRLIPFSFSADINQNYALEFGDFYMRVIQNGGYVISSGVPYQIATPWAAEDLALLKYSQSNDTMTLTHPGYFPQDLTRADHDDWTLAPNSFGTSIDTPTGLAVTPSDTGTASFSYTVTAVGFNGDESLPADPVASSAGVNITATEGSNIVEWVGVAGASYYNVYRAVPATNSELVPKGAQHGFIGRTFGPRFLDSNIVPDFSRTPPLFNNPFADASIQQIRVTAGGSGYNSSTVINITDGTGSGWEGFPIINDGAIIGVVTIRPGEGYSGSVSAAATVGTGATLEVDLTPATGNYPGVSTYFQQRKWFAASYNAPQDLWATRPGRYNNMDVSIPVIDNDALNYTLDSNQSNAIKHLVTMPGGLVILTASGAWQLSGGSQNAPVTATNALAIPQAYNGCNDLRPIAINHDLLYVQSKGSIVRALSYNLFANVYTGTDMSILSNHLFKGRTLVDWTYSEEPYKIIWVVSDDGVMLSFTYLKDQDVYAWAQHQTKGLVQNVCTVQEGNEDVLYLVVERKVEGTWRHYVERMVTREFTNVEDSWFVDAGLEYPLTYPAAGLAVDLSEGNATFTATAAVFSAGSVGCIIRAGGGIAEVTEYVSDTEVRGTWTTPMTSVLPEDADNTPLPLLQGEWSCTEPVTTVSGLDHLEGQEVAILADGNVEPRQVVSLGTITLQTAATRIIVGLPYRCVLHTLPLDAGEPTIQGRMKRVFQLAMKVNETRGLKVGPRLDRLMEVKERGREGAGQPIQLASGEEAVVVSPQWDETAQTYVVQDNPLPATVLALVPDVRIEGVSK